MTDGPLAYVGCSPSPSRLLSPPLQVFTVRIPEIQMGTIPEYRLSSMVCYYGQHYMAFVHNREAGTWLLFDDASISSVGSWPDVVRKCQAGRIQPSVLFFELGSGR